jgi:hypothetical protein
MTYEVISLFYFCNAILGQPCSLGYLVYNQIHDSIKATTKSKVTSNSIPNMRECKILRTACQNASDPKLLQQIDKNAIINNFDKNCTKTGCLGQVTTIKKGEPTEPPITYPLSFHLQTCAQLLNENKRQPTIPGHGPCAQQHHRVHPQPPRIVPFTQ